jgi:hypothetical protein
MTKYYFRLLLLLGSVVGFFAIVGSLLPRSYSFVSEVSIASSQQEIFQKINSLKEWQAWSKQWNPNEIEGLEIRYNGESEGVGAAQSWTDVRGNGKLWITKSKPFRLIEYDMEFGSFPKMISQIELKPAGDQVCVTWSSQGRLPGGPFYGYFAPFFSSQMQAEYERSLENLKRVVESNEAPSGEAPPPASD